MDFDLIELVRLMDAHGMRDNSIENCRMLIMAYDDESYVTTENIDRMKAACCEAQ